ncbi:hypothetical protein MFRU_015g00050 [Monilinia fructicola]|nr:hypothetical protein MFRU_015g00050 [Monilinia fructicola]
MSPPESSKKIIKKSDVNVLQPSTETQARTLITVNLRDADEALAFFSAHPKAGDISIEGNAILQDPLQNKKLIRKIDLTIPHFWPWSISYNILIKPHFHMRPSWEFEKIHVLLDKYSKNARFYELEKCLPSSLGLCRGIDAFLPGVSDCRNPDSVSCTAYFSPGSISRGKYHAMGFGPGISCCMYNLHRSCDFFVSYWAYSNHMLRQFLFLSLPCGIRKSKGVASPGFTSATH